MLLSSWWFLKNNGTSFRLNKLYGVSYHFLWCRIYNPADIRRHLHIICYDVLLKRRTTFRQVSSRSIQHQDVVLKSMRHCLNDICLLEKVFSSFQLTVYDIIYGPLDMCSSAPSSQKDFIVITTDGVYIYDDYSDLTTGPCKGPLNFKSIFDGYGSLNTVDQVSGTLVYQNKVELYSSCEF